MLQNSDKKIVDFLKIKISESLPIKQGVAVIAYLLMDYDIWNILTNYKVHDTSDLSDHCSIEFSINAQIREKEEIRSGPSDMRKYQFKLIRSSDTDEILNQLVSQKK